MEVRSLHFPTEVSDEAAIGFNTMASDFQIFSDFQWCSESMNNL